MISGGPEGADIHKLFGGTPVFWLERAKESGVKHREAHTRWLTALAVGNGAALLAVGGALLNVEEKAHYLLPSGWAFLIAIAGSALAVRADARYWHNLARHQGFMAAHVQQQREIMNAVMRWSQMVPWKRSVVDGWDPKDPRLGPYWRSQRVSRFGVICEWMACSLFIAGLGYPLLLRTIEAWKS